MFCLKRDLEYCFLCWIGFAQVVLCWTKKKFSRLVSKKARKSGCNQNSTNCNVISTLSCFFFRSHYPIHPFSQLLFLFFTFVQSKKVVRVHFMDDQWKAFTVEDSTTAAQLKLTVADRIGMKQHSSFFIFEKKDGWGNESEKKNKQNIFT